MTSLTDLWDCGDRPALREMLKQREQEKLRALEREADACCPHCGNDAYDLIKYERGHEGRGWFNRCCYCQHEWDAK